MAIKIKWTKERIARMLKAGRGQGELQDYHAWIKIREFNSNGEATALPSYKLNRDVQLFSSLEKSTFIVIESRKNFWDCREQFPLLDMDLAKKIAKQMGVAYPRYPGTNVPAVFTIDFMAHKKVGNLSFPVAFDVKRHADLEDERNVRNLELHRRYCKAKNIEHHLVTEQTIPFAAVKNISEIRQAHLSRLDEEQKILFSRLRPKVLDGIESMEKDMSLDHMCGRIDGHLQLVSGTSRHAVQQLILLHQISIDLNVDRLFDTTLAGVMVPKEKT